MDLARVAARGASVTFLSQAIRILAQLVSLLIMSRLLTPAQIGLFAMVVAVVGVADLIRDFGLSQGAIQAPTLSAQERDNLFWINLGLGGLCTLACLGLAPVLALIYRQPEVTAVTLALAVTFLLSGATTQYRADLTRRLQFKRLAVVDIVAQVLATVAAVVAAWNGMGYWAMVVQQILIVAAGMFGCMIAARWIPRWYRRGLGTRRFFAFGAPILGTNVLGYGLNNVDNIGIGAVWGAGPLGMYSRAFQLVGVPLQQINAPLNTVVLPVLSRVQDDDATFHRYVRRFNILTSYVFGVGLCVMAGLAWPLVEILLGHQWSGAAPVFALLAVGGVFRVLTMVSYQVYVAKALTKTLFKQYLWTRPVMMLLILAGLPWGPVGVAVGQLVAAAWFWWYSVRAMGRYTGTDVRGLLWESARAVLVTGVPCALIGYGVTVLVSNQWLAVLAGGLAALAWVGVSAAVPPVRRDLHTVYTTLQLLRAAR